MGRKYPETHHAPLASPGVEAPQETPKQVLLARWQEFLANGGFFNPELMSADALRDLALDTRDYLKAAAPGVEAASPEKEK